MKNKKYGSRAEVIHGNAQMTTGRLKKKDLKYNKKGKIVSKKASKIAKKNKNLIKAGYYTKKGKFGYIKGGGLFSKDTIKKVVQVNLSWQVQSNLEKGSAKDFVKHCKNTYDNSSKCTIKLAEVIKDKIGIPDVVCVAEGVKKTKTLFLDVIFGENNYNIYTHKLQNLVIIAVKKSLDKQNNNKIIEYNLATYKGGSRLFIGLYINNLNTLICSSHWGHDLSEKQYTMLFDTLTKEIEKEIGDKKPNIIFCGDFNDHQHLLMELVEKQRIKLLGQTLYRGNTPQPKTCCFELKKGSDKNILKYGYADYIFSSNNNFDVNMIGESGYHRYRKQYFLHKLFRLKMNPYGSDHDPIVAEFK